MKRTLTVLLGGTSFMLLMIKLSDNMTFSWSGFLLGLMWGLGVVLLFIDWVKILKAKEEKI